MNKVYKFNGGLCSIASGEKAADNQLQEAINCMVVEDGILRKRYGAQFAGNATSQIFDHFVLDVAGYSNIYGEFQIQSCNDKKLYNGSASVIHTYTNGGLGQFLILPGNRLLHTNGRDAAYIIDYTLAANGVALGFPLSRIAFKHNDRVFAAVDDTLYETEVNEYPSVTVDYFATGASWNIGAKSKSPIVGLGSIGRNLIILKSDSVYVQSGYTKNERQTYLLSDQYGCLAADSVKNANLTGIGECVIFLSNTKRLCAVTMQGIIELGDFVQDILDTVYSGTAVNEKSLSINLHRARACILDGDYYVMGFATTSDDTHNAFNQAICMSLKHPYQSSAGMKWPITLWKDTGRLNDYTGVCNTSRQTFGALNNYGNVATTIISGAVKYGVSTFSSNLYRDYQRLTDNYWIDLSIKTKNEDAGEVGRYKNWEKVSVNQVSSVPSIGSELYVTQDCDYEYSEYLRDSVNNPLPVVYKQTLWRQMSPGATPQAGYLYEYVADLVNDGIQSAVLIENFEISAAIDTRIHSVSVDFIASCKV